MLRLVKRYMWAGLLGLSLQVSFGYAFLGDYLPWQTADLGYQMFEDVGGPHNYDEEFRRNVPILYYSYDASFLVFFGAVGATEIDKAFDIYNSLKAASDYSSLLTEVPLNAARMNWTAESLSLLDLKTQIISLMTEQLGLAPPERFTWTLRDRFPNPNGGGPCPLGLAYLIVQRNFDTLKGDSLYNSPMNSSYVNNVLYSYEIVETCGGTPTAVASVFPVDPLADSFSSVAGGAGLLRYGGYLVGLTRDDVAGLRALLSTNNMNYESPPQNATVFTTNMAAPTWMMTSNLWQLAAVAATNDAAGMMAAFPGLIDTTTFTGFGIVFTTNFYFSHYTNSPWDPVSLPPSHPVYVTNVTWNVVSNFTHAFQNVYVLSNSPSGAIIPVPLTTVPKPNGYAWVTYQDVTIGPYNSPWAPLNTITNMPYTNITTRTVREKVVLGEFIIIPEGSCGILFDSYLYTNVFKATNVLISATNVTTGGLLSATNTTSRYVNQIVTLTNHIVVVYPVECGPAQPGIYQGIEKLTFVRRDYDSLLTRLFTPLTNIYRVHVITNHTILAQTVQRVVSEPDFLIAAEDMISPPPFIAMTRSVPTWNTSSSISPDGPGTIDGPTTFTFGKGGPVWANLDLANTNGFLTEATQFPLWFWSRFDGTTNPMVIFPNEMTLIDLENLLLVQFTPLDLPNGAAGQPYQVMLNVVSSTPNFQPPYVWSVTANSPALPPGFFFSPGGADPTLSSAPTTGPIELMCTSAPAGFYYFRLDVTDVQGRTMTRNYTLYIQ
jgi:hypothetical protein